MTTASFDDVTLYQFALCPFCNKVRAALDLKGVAYKTVEVTPRDKKELPPLPEGAPKKVPVITMDGETIADSTTILKHLAQFRDRGLDYMLSDEQSEARALEIEDWIDENFIKALPTVIYGTFGEAAQAARVIARESNFGPLQGIGVKWGGAFIMHMISKRILSKAGRTDGHEWVRENLDQFEEWLGDNDFICGPDLSTADVAMHGGLCCVKDFPVFEQAMDRPKLRAWFDRVQAAREQYRPQPAA